MQVLLIEVQSLFAVTDVSPGYTVDLTLCSRSDRIVTSVVDLLGGLNSTIFALGDGSRMAVVHVTSINGVIRLLISGSCCVESYASVTVYGITIIRL